MVGVKFKRLPGAPKKRPFGLEKILGLGEKNKKINAVKLAELMWISKTGADCPTS
jgi:hypothetical protein